MKTGTVSAIVFGLALCCAAYAQDATQPPPAAQTQGMPQGGWHGQHPGMGGMHGLEGTVTEAAADRYTVKTEAGDVYTVHFSANTRIINAPQMHRMTDEPGETNRPAPAPPSQLKPDAIAAGDMVAVMGEIDPSAKTVGAVVIMKMDPERAREMRQMHANYGKTWLQGRVTAVSGVKVSLLGIMDNAEHTFVADENTTFRKRREPITLADVAVGDTMRVEGAIKNGTFVASSVIVMALPHNGMATVPRTIEPQAQPTPQAPQ